MTANDLRTWQKIMNFDNAAAAEALGLAVDDYCDLLKGSVAIEQRTALACSALAAGLGPWNSTSVREQVPPGRQIRAKRQLLLPVHD
ncbi:hypothetical protein [Curvibacter lanceolatus]|uniref:hypothetical protein n=1 Tax=Curvibacter lanceolatus TaxID=86182 RepID=UPI0012F72ABC|nr:hypothetical protein [Curvibacter lanceolatus]